MLSRRQKMALDAMEIPVWKIRPEPDRAASDQSDAPPDWHTLAEPPASQIPQPAVEATEPTGIPADIPVRPLVDKLTDLQAQVVECQACELARSRTNTVFGSGDEQARLMIIGEAPGAEEDRQGLPFVGAAGLLLSELLFAIGLKREQVYIANVLKCRPPNNRDPNPGEIQACAHFLRRQIELIEPDLILVLGRVAAQNLLHTKDSLARLRGKQYCYADTDIPLMISYHPAYLLRTPKDKARAWQDLKKVRSFLSVV